MKVLVFTVLSVLVICSAAEAGLVFGVIKAGSGSVGAGIKIECLTGTTVTDSTRTDKNGFYQMQTRNQGTLKFRVTYDGQYPTIEVPAYDKPVRYNLRLVNNNGTYILRRD